MCPKQLTVGQDHTKKKARHDVFCVVLTHGYP